MWHTSLIHYLIGLLYLILFSRWLWTSRINERFGLSKQRLLSIFLLKVFWCFAFIFVHLNFSSGLDTIDFFQQSEQVYRSLFRDPIDYLRLVFLPNHWYVSESLYHYNQAMSRYGDESTFLLIRLNAIFRLFSFGSYSAQAVMFSIITLPGILLLYSFFTSQLNIKSKSAIIILMVLPVTAFWVHGVHKEALLLSATGTVLYAVTISQKNLHCLLMLLMGLMVLTIIRSHYLLFVLPVIVSILFSRGNQKTMLWTFTAALTLIVAFGVLYFYIMGMNIIEYVQLHRAEYIALGSNLLPEVPTLLSVLSSPFAVFISPIDFQSFPNSTTEWIMLLFTLSALGYVVYESLGNNFKLKEISLILISIALIEFLIIGLIVVQHGAIARYRAPLYCLLLAGVLSMISEKKRKNISDFT